MFVTPDIASVMYRLNTKSKAPITFKRASACTPEEESFSAISFRVSMISFNCHLTAFKTSALQDHLVLERVFIKFWAKLLRF